MKNFIKTFIVGALLINANLIGYADKLPVVEILGKNYYVYESKKGETLFGIAKDNNWDFTTLNTLNPKVISPTEKGIKIFYPVIDTVKPSEDSPETGVKDNNSKKHLVKLGETVYGISKLYSISMEEIYRLNPGSKNGIREGEYLVIKSDSNNNSDNPKSEQNSRTPLLYTIKKGDTLLKVARDHDTTVASILKENPGISEKNFKTGEVIRLPKRGTGIKKVTKTYAEEKVSSFENYKVDKSDTWETIAQKTGISKEDLIEANKSEGDRPKRKSIVTIPKIDTVYTQKIEILHDPRELTKEGIADIYGDVHNLTQVDSLKEVNMVVILSDPQSKKDIEYMRGALMSIDNLKNIGAHINFSVLDGNSSSTDILTALSENDTDVVMLTMDKGIPSWLADYASVSQTPMVNVFDIKNELYITNPYIVQLLTPSNYFNDALLRYFAKEYKDYNLLFVGNLDDGDQLASALMDTWNKNKVVNLTVEELKNFQFTPEKNYLIYGNPIKKDEVSDVLNTVIDVKTLNPYSGISLIGRPNWIVYEDVLKEKLHVADAMIPSRFFYDKSDSNASNFEETYKVMFKNSPTKSFPMYAALGYDATTYFVEKFIDANKDLNAMPDSSTGIQSNFGLYRENNWSGLLNPIVYIVRFTPFDSIEKILVK